MSSKFSRSRFSSPNADGDDLWVDNRRLTQAARLRDRSSVQTQLQADEGPLLPQQIERVPYVPEPPSRLVRPRSEPRQVAISGWEFVARLREATEPIDMPQALRQIYKAVEFEFDYHMDDNTEDSMMCITTSGLILVNPRHNDHYENWLFCMGHLLYHLALGYIQPPEDSPDPQLWMRACEQVVNRHMLVATRMPMPMGFEGFQQSRSPFNRLALLRSPNRGKVPSVPELLAQWADPSSSETLPTEATWRSPAGTTRWDVIGQPDQNTRYFRALYTLGQIRQFRPREVDRNTRYLHTDAARAHRWFMESFPLLSTAAAEFKIDFENAARHNIGIAAVNAKNQKIYLNLEADLTEMEWRFVIGHEILHVVLEHHRRLNNRDPMVWNLACDYVINNWLVQMGVGVIPPRGGLYKREYAGKDAETIYEELVKNQGNDQLKLEESFRGEGVGDILDFDDKFKGEDGSSSNSRSRFRPSVRQMVQNDARKMLEDKSNGIERGDIPGDLLEQLDLSDLQDEYIETPPWKAELADWFQVQFTPKPPRRSYLRPSRRQSSAPDIPRPGSAKLDLHSPTFGVILDTSGSMSHDLLRKGFAALVAYAEQHGVAQVRLIMCDTRPFDEGMVSIHRLREPYRIWGRGGTTLQPAVDMLLKAEDFPEDAPVLLITDGAIDVLEITREHAFLLPGNGQLPFEAQGPVFRILGENQRGLFGRRPTSSDSSSEDSGTEVRKRFGGFRPRTQEDENPADLSRSPFRRGEDKAASRADTIHERPSGLLEKLRRALPGH